MDKSKSKYIIEKSVSLLEALKVLNESGKRIVFLVENGILRGSLTYGDVSRWILKGNSLDAPSFEAATLNPVSVNMNSQNTIDSIFAKNNVNALPIVDSDNVLQDIVFKDEEKNKFNQIDLPVVIMAGGKGSRLYPYTKILPKPLIPIGEIPISEHIVNRFCMNGCDEFFFIVNYKKNMIKAYFNEIEHSYSVKFIDEETPLGTGGGLKLMEGMISSTFIFTNCDSFIDEDYSKIYECHKNKGNKVTMICSNQKYEIPYGVIEDNPDGGLVSMKEKPKLSYLVNTGTYIVEPEVISMINLNENIGFPDVIQRVKNAGQKVGVYIVDGLKWLDMGQMDTMEEMKKRLNILD